MEEFLNLLDQYGLWALAVGAFFQGYCLVFLAGMFVSQKALGGFEVWIVAAISAWVGHWFFYGIGRWLSKNRHIIHSRRFNDQLDHLDKTITIHPWMAVFFTQYGYGVRIVGAIAFGLSHVRRRWFAVAQILNCAIWAALLSAVGYATGSGLFSLPDHIIKPATMALSISVFAFFLFKKRRRMVLEKAQVVMTKE